MQAASHQRQLSLKYSEVQQRLIDNQGLLNTLEKSNEESLKNLLAELKRRVEQDKEALRQWTALRKSNVDSEANKNPTLAAKLLQFSRGCALALQLMNEDSTQVTLRFKSIPSGKLLSLKGSNVMLYYASLPATVSAR